MYVIPPMFHLIKAVIWITGAFFVAGFVLRYFGYEPNWSYWDEQRATCIEMADECRETLIRKGTDGAREECRFDCIDPRTIIRKTDEGLFKR